MDGNLYDIIAALDDKVKRSNGVLTKEELAHISGTLGTIRTLYTPIRDEVETPGEDGSRISKLFRG